MNRKEFTKTVLFRDIFSEALFALSFDTLGLIAGFIASLIASYVVKMSWVLILYPPLLTVRGNISGVFSGRLTTALHLGLIKPRIRKNTDYFYNLRATVLSMSFINALTVGFLSYSVSFFFGSSSDISLLIFIMIALLSMMIPTCISIFFLAPLIAFSSYKKGTDPDVIVYPIMSTLNDIIVSATYVLIVIMLIFFRKIFTVLSYVLCLFFTLLFVHSLKYRTSEDFRKTFLESMPTVIILAVISNFAGGVLSKLKYQIERFPHILVIYPCLIDSVGDEGSIIASTITTKLSLGDIEPSFREVSRHESRTYILGTFSAGFIVFGVFAIIGSLTYAFSLIEVLRSIFMVILTNAFLMIPLTLISFGLALVTFKRGLNPDNFTIPIIASLSDFLTTITLFLIVNVIMGL